MSTSVQQECQARFDASCDFFHKAKTLNPEIRAFSQLIDETLFQDEFRLATEKHPNGLLTGHVFAIKNNVNVAGFICNASLPTANKKAETDADIVTALKNAGAQIHGVTKTDSGAFGVTTPDVTNPLYPDLMVGGSSGGSAAAVAADMCFAAIGTDTGGSIRIPAACCGIYGLKPTQGSTPMNGIHPLSPSCDHVGPLARSVNDIITIMKVIAPDLAQDPSKSLDLEKITLGTPEICIQDASHEVKQIFQSFLRYVESKGATITTIRLPTPEEVGPTHMDLALYEAEQVYRDIDGDTLAKFPNIAKEGIAHGHSVTPERYEEAKRTRIEITKLVEKTFETVNFIIMPTLPILPPQRDTQKVMVGSKEMDILSALTHYTKTFNQSGSPVLAFPWPKQEKNASTPPGSIQLIGPKHCDHKLLGLAKALEI